MVEVLLEGLAPKVDEATIQNWYFEEGDPVNEGDDLLDVSTSEGIVTIHAATSGILAEVYYDEGETVPKGEVLCAIDEDDSSSKGDDEDEDEEEEASDEDEEEVDADEDEDEDEDEDDEDAYAEEDEDDK